VAQLLAQQWNSILAAAALTMPRIKFPWRQACRWNCAVRIALPQNRPQTAAIVFTEISNDTVDLLIRYFRGDPIHPRLATQCFAQRRRAQPILRPGCEHCQSSRITTIQYSSHLANIDNLQPPTVP